jgi:hypothetical protein
MKTISLLTLATTTAGCYCGAFGGNGDQFYKRGNETLTICAQGGFIMNRDSGPIEGVFGQPTPESPDPVFDDGATGARAFTLVAADDGSVMTPELGGDPWQPLVYTDAQRDHADIPCEDLPHRPWWGTPAAHMPVDTAFAIPNPDRVDELCGQGDPTPSCNIELDLCVGMQLAVGRDGSRSDGAFTINYGVVSGHWYTADGKQTELAGMYTADGVLTTTDFYGGQGQTRWTRIPPDPTKPVAGCR